MSEPGGHEAGSESKVARPVLGGCLVVILLVP